MTVAEVLRVSVRASTGSVDLLAGPGTTPAALLAGLPPVPGLPTTAGLVTLGGRRLDAQTPLGAQGVDDGDVLLLVEALAPGAEEPAAVRQEPRQRTGPLVGAVLALAGALAVSLTAGPASRTVVATAVFALAALCMLAPASRWGDACRLLAPPLAAASTALLVLQPQRPGQAALACTAAAVTAALVAAVLQVSGRAALEGLTVELAGACLLAVVSWTGLVLGAPGPAVAAGLVALAACLVRVLPALAIDVPDEALLDLDRVSVTAWSAAAVKARRPLRVRSADVVRQVGDGRRLLDAAVVAVVLVALCCLPVLLARPASGLQRWGALLLTGCLAAAFALAARAFRGPVPRTALLLGGAVAVVVLSARLAGQGGGAARLLIVFAALGGAAAVVAAVALGRGWRSVRWARAGDLVEGLAVTLALPAAVVAAGGVEHVRRLVS